MSFPTVILEIAPGSNPSDQNPSWTDISDRLVGFTFKRGRTWELDNVQTGTATFNCENHDRVLDPSYTLGPFSGALLPFTQIRFRMTYSGTTYNLFRGFIERIPLTYEGPDAAFADLECVDLFAALSQAQISGSFVEQLTGARITAVLSAAGWTTTTVAAGWTLGTGLLGTSTRLGATVPTNVIDAGKATVAATTFAAADKQNALAHIQKIAESEPGLFFFDGQGRAVFKDRSHVTPTPDASVLTFTDDPAAADATHVAYKNVVLSYDPDRVNNDVELTAADGTLASTSDAVSVDQYFRRTLNRDTLLRSTGSDLAQQAGYLLYLFKDARIRADSVDVDVWATDAWAQIFAREPGDNVTVLRTPATHPVTTSQTITQASTIESITHTGQPTTDWSVTFQVASLPPTIGGWQLGVSLLGANTRLIYA